MVTNYNIKTKPILNNISDRNSSSSSINPASEPINSKNG